jgi:PadR family transcriptional regulator
VIAKGELPDELIGKHDLELRRGVPVLAVLSQPGTAQYGYLLRQALASEGMPIEQGTLYPLLRRLESLNLLKIEWRIEDGAPRRYDTLSAEGIRHDQNLQCELGEARQNGEPPDRQQEVGHEAIHATEVIEGLVDARRDSTAVRRNIVSRTSDRSCRADDRF